jgi:glycolate dehydrogenase FAD-binding subunit
MGTTLSALAAAGLQADIREPDADCDPIDAVIPRAIVEPRTADAAAATLAWASEHHRAVVIRGSGTKTAWGRIPRPIDLVLSTRQLNHIVTHRAGDLTVTVDAGVTLGDLNRVLRQHRQWLPVDPLFGDQSTIGGLLATNDSGPRRHRFGTPRDLVIGIQLATVDGKLAKAGGQVVKNVAGYDLSKLVCGSFGELAAIVSATFKLSPVPTTSGTIAFGPLDSATVARIASVMALSQLEPVSFECHASVNTDGASVSGLLLFESFHNTVDAQIAAARACLGPITPSIRLLSADAERDAWSEHTAQITNAPGALVRASWQPSQIDRAIDTLPGIANGGPLELIGRVGVGAGVIRVDGDVARQSAVVEQLRSGGVFGNVVVIRATPALKSAIDAWGPRPNRTLLQSIKKTLDPTGTLGAGRGLF